MNKSTDLKLVYQNVGSTKENVQPIFLLCVFRDEELLLNHFIKYYQSIGVTHFIMVDNLSEDNGVKYLKELNDVNMTIYSAERSFKDAAFGTRWINILLEKHCVDKYCFVVDADELFCFDTNKFENIHKLIEGMEAENKNIIQTFLLDMYPKKINNNYKKGDSFLEHSQFFDQYNTRYYHENTTKAGGMRERIFGTTVCIQKFSFFKYNFNPIEVGVGYHTLQLDGESVHGSDGLFFYQGIAALLHFKFIKPKLKDFFKKRCLLNEDWDDSIEYKAYVATLSNKHVTSFFDKNYSVKFNGVDSLNCFYKLQSLNQQVKRCDAAIQKKNSQIKQNSEMIEQKDKIIKQKKEVIKEKNGEIQGMQKSKFWKMRNEYINLKNKIGL